jgi:murein DD-endopeptidase MepM/ murein hydrolase activator NlpD
MKKLIPITLLVIASIYPLTLLFLSTPTVLQVDQQVKVIGVSTPIRVVAVNPHGIRELTATIEQGGRAFEVFTHAEPSHRWRFMRGKENPRTFVIDPGTRNVTSLRDGKAHLAIEAKANDLRGKADRLEFDVDVDTRPPLITVDKYTHNLTLGGVSVVTFTTGGYVSESGVRVGRYRFRSFPYDGKRICFFVAPHDLTAAGEALAYARNPAGAEAVEKLKGTIVRRPFRRRHIIVDDKFLKKVLEELDPGGKGDPVARFTKINNDLRQANNQAISGMRMQTEERMLWNGPFRQLSRSKAEAQFCDYRTYFYKGQSVDEQVHFGFDLAGMKRMPVNAANDGKVIFAGPLGIYGNTVVIDHGFAIQSLYAHMSEVAVKPGQIVKKDETIGNTGTTGLASGDHLHFSMQVDGIFADPRQWWDARWYESNLASRLK